uniref:Uncharacterized protein n=1 Tax=Onchocerca volvulus TaxID=6282 RepID=A0A8R1XRK0_ONCVO
MNDIYQQKVQLLMKVERNSRKTTKIRRQVVEKNFDYVRTTPMTKVLQNMGKIHSAIHGKFKSVKQTLANSEEIFISFKMFSMI